MSEGRILRCAFFCALSLEDSGLAAAHFLKLFGVRKRAASKSMVLADVA